MTKDQLRQFNYLSKEIQMWQKQLFDLRASSRKNMNSIIKTKYDKRIKGLLGDLPVHTDSIELIILKRQSEAQLLRLQILKFIDSIDDSLLRQVIVYRYIDGLSWIAVASKVGGNNSPSGLRIMVDRFLASYEAGEMTPTGRDGGDAA